MTTRQQKRLSEQVQAATGDTNGEINETIKQFDRDQYKFELDLSMTLDLPIDYGDYERYIHSISGPSRPIPLLSTARKMVLKAKHRARRYSGWRRMSWYLQL